MLPNRTSLKTRNRTVEHGFTAWQFLLVVNLLLLVLGMFLEVASIMLRAVTYVPALSLWSPNLVYG